MTGAAGVSSVPPLGSCDYAPRSGHGASPPQLPAWLGLGWGIHPAPAALAAAAAAAVAAAARLGILTSPQIQPPAGLACDTSSTPPAAAVAEAGPGISWSPPDAMLAAAAAGTRAHLRPTAAVALLLWQRDAAGRADGVWYRPASAWPPPERLQALPSVENAAALAGLAHFRFGTAQSAGPPLPLTGGGGMPVWPLSLSQLACAATRPQLHARLLNHLAGGPSLGL